ncbi:short-chain dehydrogenase/reductase [Fulvitalea axinellae]|uniref:Short-chain dehydrogenase/reductase n=1 Tax=Fulvitalea axinellae TaxID=1182444 RepID=A0AAU9D2P1_9BACT|nr:short-chain dehydrogenase/reductase [Fulvitalea axinellae]
MSKEKETKVVLVTGASSGIGQAIARHLAKSGYKVYGTSRKIRQEQGVIPMIMDVNNEDSVQQTVNDIIEDEGRLDAVVNCAGLGINGSVEEMPVKEAKAAFETNFFGVMRVCQAVMPQMRKQRYGAIINVSSIAGEVGLPFRGYYSASKFAVEGLTEALRMEARPFGVRVMILQPGDFNTNIANSRRGQGVPKDSPYHKLLTDMERQIKEGMDKAPGPEEIGPYVERMLKKSNPALRYRVGALLETITPTAKRILPQKLFQKLIMSFYGLNGVTPEDIGPQK